MIDLSAGPLDSRDASYSRRMKIARGAILDAVAHYHAMMVLANDIWDTAAVHLGVHGPARYEDESDPERIAWKAVREAANQRFDSAELALAHVIQNFHAWFIPGAGDPERLPYPDCAVKVNGIIYVLAGDVAQYEPGENFIGVVTERRVIDLGMASEISQVSRVGSAAKSDSK